MTYKPEINFPWAKEDVICSLVKVKESQPVLWSVAYLVKDSLDASISSDVPNLENFVSTKTDQVVSVLVNCQVLHRSVMTIEIRQSSKSERVPHDNVTLLSTTSHESVLWGVDEGIHSLLMQIEGLVLLIWQVLYVVNMDEAI